MWWTLDMVKFNVQRHEKPSIEKSYKIIKLLYILYYKRQRREQSVWVFVKSVIKC